MVTMRWSYYFAWRPCHDHAIFHDDHDMILPWSYHGEYEPPWSYLVIAWSSCLTMAVNPGKQNVWKVFWKITVKIYNFIRHMQILSIIVIVLRTIKLNQQLFPEKKHFFLMNSLLQYIACSLIARNSGEASMGFREAVKLCTQRMIQQNDPLLLNSSEIGTSYFTRSAFTQRELQSFSRNTNKIHF